MTAYTAPGIINAPRPITHPIEAVELILIEHYETNLITICCKCRKRDITYLRQIVQACLAINSKLSLQEVGDLTGNRHYSSIIHSRKIIEDAQYIEKKMGKLSDTLNDYYIFLNRYKQIMIKNNIIVMHNYRGKD